MRRASGPPSGRQKCVRPIVVCSGWVRGRGAAWSEVAGLLLFLPLPGSGPLVDPHPPRSPWPRCCHLTGGSLQKHDLLGPLLLVIPRPPSSIGLPLCSGLQGSRTVGAMASRHAAGRCAPTPHQDPALGGRRPQSQVEIPLWLLTSPRLMFLTSFWTSLIGERGRQAAMSWAGRG